MIVYNNFNFHLVFIYFPYKILWILIRRAKSIWQNYYTKLAFFILNWFHIKWIKLQNSFKILNLLKLYSLLKWVSCKLLQFTENRNIKIYQHQNFRRFNAICGAACMYFWRLRVRQHVLKHGLLSLSFDYITHAPLFFLKIIISIVKVL